MTAELWESNLCNSPLCYTLSNEKKNNIDLIIDFYVENLSWRLKVKWPAENLIKKAG